MRMLLVSSKRRPGEPVCPFKEMVNSMLRLGLNTRARTRALPPFKVKAKPLGLQPGLSYDNIEDLLERTEGILHR
jgi:hypothetical protein